jgi:hypothetical protein
MRLWTIHPKYLDTKGLLAVWREALLAQKVLRGKTQGYTNHPQLQRFRAAIDPLGAIGAFLLTISDEAVVRQYNFDNHKIIQPNRNVYLTETSGQLLYEWTHLKQKLQARAPQLYRSMQAITQPDPNPIFHIIPGDIREWEHIQPKNN